MSRYPSDFENHPRPFPESAEYRGVCRYVVDGDTMDVIVDCGFNIYHYLTVRLRGIDTPEIYRPEDEEELRRGQKARGFVEGLILDQPILLTTYESKRSFGRYVADIQYYKSDSEQWIDLAAKLIEAGYAD